MALLTYNGTNFDNCIGSASLGGTNVNLTTTGITSLGNTAPNTSNYATGVWIAIASATNSPNTITVELLESGVSKASAVINQADHVIGFNYVRFATPYKFTTTAAGAYTVRVKTSSTNSGSLRTITSGNLWNQITYDSGVSIGASDDIMIGGFNDSGLTPKTYTYTGTTGSWGSGTAFTWSSTAQWDMASPIICGSGGSFVFDTTADTTLTVKGAIVVYKGGVFDMRPGTGFTNTLIFNQNGTDGNYGIISPTSGLGGQILTTGPAVAVGAQYASGDGTTGTPATTASAHGFVVGQEVVIPGLTYGGNQVKYIKTIPTPTTFTTSNTAGGAESGFTNTPAVGSWIANMTRNSIIKNTGTTHGFWIYNSNTNPTPLSDFKWTRFEYANCASGRGLNFNLGSSATTDANDADFTGSVFYNNSASGRNSITWTGKLPQTVTDLVLYNTRGSNFSAQSGLVFQSYNKTANRVYHYAEPSSTTNCAGASFSTSSVSNTLTNFHSYGANAANGSLGYAIGFYGVNNTVADSTVNSARVTGMRANSAQSMTISNSSFGTIGTNTVDLTLDSSTLNTMLFSDCSFSSATLISGYTSGLDGTEIKFHQMDGNNNKHRWYTKYGSAWSSGTGLTDTTVRTASSLALVVKPEDNSTGFFWETTIPQNPTAQVGIFGYVYRNATFSSGTLKVELFLEGSTTADATYTFPTTTGSWLPFNISAYNSASTTRLARVRITGITSTAGAYFFVDDLYDAGTGNKVAGLDLWYQGKPSPVIAAIDTSAIPAQVWGFTDSGTSAGTMGDIQAKAKLTNVLVADGLS